MEEKKTPEPTAISAEEWQTIGSCQAPFANKIYISSNNLGVRLTFAETFPLLTVPVARGAVFIGYADAIALRDLLTTHLQAVVAEEKK